MINLIFSHIYRAMEKAHIKTKAKKYKRRYSLDQSFNCEKLSVKFYGKGDIIGGKESYVGNFTSIQVSKGYKVTIGYRVRISHNVRFYTSTTETHQDFTARPLKTKSGNINIGDGVWIGANAVILPGISVGDNSIVGANAVVTKNIPSNQVWGGIPAKFIKNK